MNDDKATPGTQVLHNIVLIGFMGCGKSTLGRFIKEKIGYPHIDTDQAIEEEKGISVSSIFQQKGEKTFRDMETTLLKTLLEQQCNKHIISTGGGMVIRKENRRLLRKLGFVVWLTCDPKNILERTSRNSNRPLLQCDDPMSAITSLLNERTPMYRETAHLEINSSDLNFDEVACGILESARYHFSTMQ